MTFDYPFTEHDMQAAADEWGCNCGPSALAFALRIGLDKVRGKIPGFEEKRYTSPTMMKQGLVNLNARIVESFTGRNPAWMFSQCMSLVRIQFSGPWTKEGANPKWAYWHTHWIATCIIEPQESIVFDCNGGVRSFASWQEEIIPLLTDYDRADGGWFPTHVWRIGR